MASSVSGDARQIIGGIGATNPEWRPWLTLLEQTLEAVEDPAWDMAVPEPSTDRPPSAPLLDGLILSVDSGLAQAWTWRIVSKAADGGGSGAAPLAAALRSERVDALALLEAAVRQDQEHLDAIAASAGADPGAVAALAQLAAMPLLQACGRHLSSHVPRGWSFGYCPICGAWPAMAEVRGLERNRRLRCGRCGGDWGIQLLRCPFCLTTDFRQLGSLVPEEGGETRKVDTCQHCKGYVKTATTLSAWPGYRVALEDLASVELDIVALGRDYTRPQKPGYALGTRLVPAPSARRGFLGWRR